MSVLVPTWERGPVRLYLGDCREVMGRCGRVDAVIADPPFSGRVHRGHDAAEVGGDAEGCDGANRKGLGYGAWGWREVAAVVGLLPAAGWVVVFSDARLGRVWERLLARAGRYVFAPLPAVVPGRSVRLSGDGPSCWTDWIVAARPRGMGNWGTLPGAYVGQKAFTTPEHMGAKPLSIMLPVVEDYSREGDVVLDFAMGSGSTGVACVRAGRRFVGIERDAGAFDRARVRLERELDSPLLPFPRSVAVQGELIA